MQHLQYGNGAVNQSIIFVHKDGTISELNFKSDNSKTTVNLTKAVSGCSNIVSIVQYSNLGGHHAILIDSNGNMYNFLGVNN